MSSNYKLVSNWITKKNYGSELQLDPHAYKERAKKLIYSTHPASQAYPSPIPGIFLCGVEDSKLLNKSERWIIRDGLLPLLWFFEKYREPFKGLRSTLCIDFELLSVVPRAWKKAVVPRKLISLESKNQRQKLLYTGILCPQYVSIETVRSTIEGVKNSLAEHNIIPETVELFSPFHMIDYSFPDFDHYLFNYSGLFLSAYGASLKLVDLIALHNQFNYGNYLVADLNSKYLVSDSNSLNHLLSLGAMLATPPASGYDSGDFICASPFHGWFIGNNFPSIVPKINTSPERLGLKSFAEYFI